MSTSRKKAAISVVVILLVTSLSLYRALPHSRGSVTSGPKTTGCARAIGPFTTSGSQVLQQNGAPFVSYGVTVPGLANINYKSYAKSDDTQITASSDYWCANTVRLQVSQDNLVNRDGAGFSADFMDAIQAEVKLAEQRGLVVVLNDQTEDVTKEPAPTTATRSFWQHLSMAYGNDPQVVFDLFNEPRLDAGNNANDWKTWQHGDPPGKGQYLGMQEIVDTVRGTGAKNLLWIEGPHYSDSFADLRDYPIAGGSIVYAIHHPSGAHDSATWDHDFGYLVSQNIAPVVDGEWSNWASTTGLCWNDAPSAVPQYLAYLQNHQVGLTVWMLRKGVMVESQNLADPTHIRSDWQCKDGLDQGAGSDVMDWYKQQNGAR